jgi:hypothetical protein
VVVAVLVMPGCGPKEVPDDQRPLTDASSAVKNTGTDFSTVDLPNLSLEIPSDWFVADLTRGGLEERLEEVAKTNPELKDSFLTIRQAADNKSFLLYAFKTRASDFGFTDNMYVQRTQLQGSPSISDVGKHMEEQVKAVAGSSLDSTGVEKIAGLEWQRTEWSMDLSGGGQDLKLRLSNYATIHKGHLISLNFTAKDQSAAGMENDANAILASVKLK